MGLSKPLQERNRRKGTYWEEPFSDSGCAVLVEKRRKGHSVSWVTYHMADFYASIASFSSARLSLFSLIIIQINNLVLHKKMLTMASKLGVLLVRALQCPLQEQYVALVCSSLLTGLSPFIFLT